MLFTAPTFLFLFLPILLGLYFAGRHHSSYANWLLLTASILFYAVGARRFTWLVLGSIAFNYWMALAVDRAGRTRRARLLLTIAVGANLGVLIIFKYAGFLTANLNAVLNASGRQPFALPQLLLPVGISFYTFHAISYVVDVYRKDASAQKNPVHAALYLLLFPQLIAGPIIRYREIAGQLARRVITSDGFACGVRRFVIGLAKKVLVANTVAGVADAVFALPVAQLTPGHAWLGIVCYTIQIYFDFSGYSDMAIGLAAMFGFRFPENFRWPYSAHSVQDFWRRWHISLSSWFRDYLYLPLGGSRISMPRTFANLITVFFLCGLWHGAAWTFVVWGLFHGAFLVIERLGWGTTVRGFWRPLRHVYVLLVVMVGWVFFRADSLHDAAGFLAAMGGRSAIEPTPFTVGWYLTPALLLALAAGALGSVPVGPTVATWLDDAIRDRSRPARGWGMAAAGAAVLMLALAASVAQIAAGTYNPFIYFRF